MQVDTTQRGADLLVRTLSCAGVTRIFGLSGNQIMPIFDACLDAGIEIVHTRHEAAAVFMAEAYAQLTGTVGVALVTAGGGLTNAAGALFSARASDTPVLLLSGDSPLAQDGRGAFQELDQASITAPLTKLSFRAQTPSDLAEGVTNALQTAQSGCPGPVHIALPFDLLRDACTHPIPEPPTTDRTAVPDITGITKALAQSTKPLILLGPSLTPTRAPGLCNALQHALQAPVLPMESPRGLNDPSLGDLRQAVDQADLIVSLAKRIDFTLGFGAGPARWIVAHAEQAEIDRAIHNLGDRLIAGLSVDHSPLTDALLSTTGQPARNAWLSQVEALTAKRPGTTPASDHITSDSLCMAVQQALKNHPGSVVISDGGEFGQWAQALTKTDARVINGISGVIGGGLPYGIAACAARPGVSVVVLSGDGSAGFHLSEFETAARAGLPVLMVIGNDCRWNAEHQIQLRDYGPDRLSNCDLSPARYDLAAAALGAHGEYVTSPADLAPALDRALASGKPACVNVMIHGLPAPSGH